MVKVMEVLGMIECKGLILLMEVIDVMMKVVNV